MPGDWQTMSHFEKDVVRLTVVVVSAASLVGAAIGWVGHLLFDHLHDGGLSDHFKGPR